MGTADARVESLQAGLPAHPVRRRFKLRILGAEDLRATLLALPSSLWFILFLVLPLIIVVVIGFTTYEIGPEGFRLNYDEVTPANYLRALDPTGVVVRLTARTILVSLAATLASLAVSFPIAYYLARIASEARRGTYISLIIIPFWISFVVELYALLPWVQRDGYLGSALNSLGMVGFADWVFTNLGYGSPNIVVPALVYLWGTFMILPLFTSLLRIDRELLEASHDLGAGRWGTFRHVTVPLSMPGIVTGSLLVFITSFGSFVEPQLLAGRGGRLVGNYMYESFLRAGNLPSGAAVSVVVIAATLLVMYLYAVFSGRVEAEAGGGRQTPWILMRAWERLTKVLMGGKRGMPTLGGRRAEMRPARGRLETAFDGIAESHGRRILQVFTLVVIVSFYVPLVQVVIFSFNHDANIVQWSRFSLRWYLPEGTSTAERALFDDPDMVRALENSILVGLAATAVSLLVGTPTALALVRHRFWLKKSLNLMIYTGLVMPSIVMGGSILVFITYLNDLILWPYFRAWWDTGYLSIIVGHVTFCIPIVILVLTVSLKEFDRSLEEAAMDLGASELATFFRVTLPIIKPGMVSAALLSFTFSFDELIVTLFLKGQGVETLPVVMWSTLSKKIPTPEVNAVSTLIIGMSILFVLVANRVQRGGAIFRF